MSLLESVTYFTEVSSSSDSDDTSEQITDSKVTLETSRLTLKNKIVKQNRFKVEKALVTFQAGQNKIVEGENPQHILGLPNEVWEVVFDQFDDATDLISCFNTCMQFRSSCNSSQRALMQIRKTLPIVFKSGYLTHNDMLNFRLASKPFNKCVEDFYQSKKLSWQKSSPPIEYDLIPYCYNCSPLEILMQDTFLNVSKGRSIIRYQVLSLPQTRNPFLSRYIMIHDNTGLTLDRFRRWDIQVVEFLQRWGKEIWYLTLAMNCTKSRFLEILQLMPNLRHLKITGNIRDDEQEYPCSYNKLLQEACPKLTSFVFPETTKLIVGVHNNLISSFAGRIEEFQVETWETLYSEFYWPKLRRLDVNRVLWLIDICNCRADNLTELSVVLSGDENFDMFLKMVDNFPKLKVLKVNFERKFKIRDTAVFKRLMEDDIINKGGCKVKKLSLKMQVGYRVCLGILVWFPMLEYLEIEKKFAKKDKPLHPDMFNISLIREGRFKVEEKEKEKVELVEIDKFFGKNKEGNLETSNVWKILPFLKKVKINNLVNDEVKIFNRPL